ncbi:Phosphoinositide phosphatase sac1 [Microbotryomycetes sp. JL201]|nr:Phosphoinositide phosphatase sac1 [Microbotryomycetes sp. JL201]
MASTLHSDLRLYISDDAYTLVGDSEKAETLTIDRASGNVSIAAGNNPPAKRDSTQVVYGLFGIITLLQSDYLVVITKRNKVATILSTPVYAATDFSVFPIERSTTTQLLAEPDEAYLLGLLKSHLYSAPFYFTYGGSYDVTTRLQKQVGNADQPLWQRADDRFFWNRHLQRKLIDTSTSTSDKDCKRFILPVIFGFFEFKDATINGRQVLFGLISRRNRYRAGTRYFSRGIDREGNVSNFNETEQVLLLDAQGEKSAPGSPARGDIRFSYVQTRGSVPVYWAEIVNLRYKPDLKVMDLSSTAESLQRHFDAQIEQYGDQYLVNLVNQKGYEKPVKEAYEKAIEAMRNPRVHYTYFDFHHECKGLRFDRVSVLIDGLGDELQRQGYFFHDATQSPSRPQQTQTSVVRTNCMDCLDRTNVVQSALGKWVLNNQLRQIGVLSTKESIDEHSAFLSLFRHVWADNADVVSRAYSGTGALKTDYTRTGKRSKEGALQDGVNSLVRYIKNNYLDGPRQDAYDLVTGAWQPRKGDTQSWRDQRTLLVRYTPWILLSAVLGLLFVLVAPQFIDDHILASKRFALLAVGILFLTFNFITNNGIYYVSHPKLVSIDDVLNYNGKGYESGRRGRPLRMAKVKSVEGQTKKHTVANSVLPMLSGGASGNGSTAKQD